MEEKRRRERGRKNERKSEKKTKEKQTKENKEKRSNWEMARNKKEETSARVDVVGPGIGSAYSLKYCVPYGLLKHSCGKIETQRETEEKIEKWEEKIEKW